MYFFKPKRKAVELTQHWGFGLTTNKKFVTTRADMLSLDENGYHVIEFKTKV